MTLAWAKYRHGAFIKIADIGISVLGDVGLVIKYFNMHIGYIKIGNIFADINNIDDINTNKGDAAVMYCAIFYCQISVPVIFGGVKNNGNINIAVPNF